MNIFRCDLCQKDFLRSVLAQVFVELHFARIKPAPGKDDYKDKQLLGEENKNDSQSRVLWNQALNQQVDKGKQDVDKNEEIEQCKSRYRVLKDEPDGVADGDKNVVTLLDDDLDTCVIEEHLHEKQNKKDNDAERKAQIKRRYFRK